MRLKLRINPQNKSAFVRTTDWWHGNYLANGKTFDQEHGHYTNVHEGELPISEWQGQEYVEVQLLENRFASKPEYQFVRVLVSGNDDTAYEKDFIPAEYHQALELWEELVTLEPITYERVKQLGMTHV